jgi:hypothetical protein
MIITIGDQFSTTKSIYTITSINGDKITWENDSKKYYMKKVSKQMIEEWIDEGRLTKICKHPLHAREKAGRCSICNTFIQYESVAERIMRDDPYMK